MELDGRGAELGRQQWRTAVWSLIRPAEGSTEHEMERRRWRARLHGLGRGESRHGGEGWPESAPVAALLELSSVACSARARKGEQGGEIGLGDCNGSRGLKRCWSHRHGDVWHRRLCTPSPWQEQGRHTTEFECFLIKF